MIYHHGARAVALALLAALALPAPAVRADVSSPIGANSSLSNVPSQTGRGNIGAAAGGPSVNPVTDYQAKCDRYSNSDATTTTTLGVTTVSAPSGHFVAADRGKLFVIHAGPTQSFDSATIASGGFSFAAGDVGTLAGGSSTAAAGIFVGAVSGGVATHVVGGGGSYSAVPSNPVSLASTSGGGGGLTLNVTWHRNALVTTIASVVDATHITTTTPVSVDVTNAYWAYGSDDTTKINTAVAALMSGSGRGGTLSLPSRCLMAGPLILPNTGTSPPTQMPLRITSLGHFWDGRGFGLDTGGGGGLDILYDGTDGVYKSKIVTLGVGTLTLDHLTLGDSNTDNLTYMVVTNTTIEGDDVLFVGNRACYRSNCTQDMLQFGGTTSASTTLGGNSPTNGFQGYLPKLDDFKFSHTRRAATFGGSANGIVFMRPHVDYTSGSAEQYGAAFRYIGAGLGPGPLNNFVIGGAVEMPGYPYCVSMTSGAVGNVFNKIDGLYCGDGTVGQPEQGIVYADSGSIKNAFYPLFTDAVPPLSGVGTPANLSLYTAGALPSTFPTGIDSGYLLNNSFFRWRVGIMQGAQVPAYPLDIGDPTATTGQIGMRLNAGNTANGDGAGYRIELGGTTGPIFANRSYVTGSTFDPSAMIYSPNNNIYLFGNTNLLVLGTDSAGKIIQQTVTGSGTALLTNVSPTMTGTPVIGAGTGGSLLAINGGATNSGDGPAINFEEAGTPIGAFGAYSQIFNNTSYSDMLWFVSNGHHVMRLGGTTVLETFATGHVTIDGTSDLGSTLNVNGTLDVASTMTAGNATFGAGTGVADVVISGGASANQGAYLQFARNGVNKGVIGTYAAVAGGGSTLDDLTLYDPTASYHLFNINSCIGLVTDTTGKIGCAAITGSGITLVLNNAPSISNANLTGTTIAATINAATLNLSGALALTPATWADNQTCSAGQIEVDANNIYVCTATNTVKHAALAAF